MKKKNTMVKCKGCGCEFDYAAEPEVAMGAVECPHYTRVVNQEGKVCKIVSIKR